MRRSGRDDPREIRAIQEGGESTDNISADVSGILDTIDIPIVVLDLDCRVARFNQAATEVLDLSLSDIGRLPGNSRALVDVKDCEKVCAQVIADGMPCRREVRKADRWFILRIAPYLTSDRQTCGAVLTFTNVTAFRESIGQALYEREYTKAILNTMVDSLVVLDAGLRVQTANRAFFGMFGVSREATESAPLCDLGNEAWKTSALWSMLRLTLSENVEFQTVEVDHEFPALGCRTLQVDARRLLRHGQPLLLLVLRDVSERKQAEQKVRESEQEARRSRDEAERASQAKDDFLATLSHELRTPLTPVLMTATVLESDPSLPTEIRDQLAMIRRNVELEARLIDDLLDLTRICRGKLQIVPVIADLHRLLEHTAEIVRSDELGGQVRVTFKLEAPAHHTMGDPARLQQVFWNLIKNALKFTPAGGSVTVSTRNDDTGRIVVSVADTGIGIKAEVLPRIFAAFEQGEVTGQHRFGGLGLGLAISKAIVEMHSGAIRAESDGDGRGATFTVDLAAVDAPGAPALCLTAPAADGRALRLLVVDDHEPTLTVLTRLLTRSGHHVTPATCMREALAAALPVRFDAMISDLGLPDGSGIDLMVQIQRQQGCPGIALSGYGSDSDVQKAKSAGFFAHLVKPVNFESLRELLSQLPARSTEVTGIR